MFLTTILKSILVQQQRKYLSCEECNINTAIKMQCVTIFKAILH